MKVIGLSESPKHTRTDGSKQYMGEDGRDKKPQHNARGAVCNPFLDGDCGEGKHVGDGMRHNQSQPTSKAIMERCEIPTSAQTGVGMPQPVSGGVQEAEHHSKTWKDMFEHVDPPAHPGFKAVQSSIAKRQGISKARAGAILGSATRNASAAAKRANPRLKRVKGK